MKFVTLIISIMKKDIYSKEIDFIYYQCVRSWGFIFRFTFNWQEFTTKIYEKRDNFNFRELSYPFLDREIPRATSYGTYHSSFVLLRLILELKILTVVISAFLRNFYNKAFVSHKVNYRFFYNIWYRSQNLSIKLTKT